MAEPRTNTKIVEDMENCLKEAKEIWDSIFITGDDKTAFKKYTIAPTPMTLVNLAIYLDQEKRKDKQC